MSWLCGRAARTSRASTRRAGQPARARWALTSWTTRVSWAAMPTGAAVAGPAGAPAPSSRPRPLPVKDSDFTGDVRRRLLVRPGITGLWQVNDRSGLSWEDAVRLDLYYVENWSIALDLTILPRTVGAVVRGTGAY